MKVEVIKEFSSVHMTDRFWVYLNGIPKQSCATVEESLQEIAKIKLVLEKTYPPELVHSEEF